MLDDPAVGKLQVAGMVCMLPIAAMIVVGCLVAAWQGKDLKLFESFRQTSPKRYSRLVMVGRINGLVVLMMSLGGIVFSPFLLFDAAAGSPALRIPTAIALFLFGFAFAWLSWRRTHWAWSVRL
jgi:hypothetical protein